MPHQSVGQKAIALIAETDHVPSRLLELRLGVEVLRLGVVKGGTYLGREVCERVTRVGLVTRLVTRLGVTRGVVRVR